MKTELNLEFDYRDDPRIVSEHNQMIILSILFAFPVIGWVPLFVIILAEFLWKKFRYVRLYLLILYHELRPRAGGSKNIS